MGPTLAALGLAAALAAPGSWATATYRQGTLALALHYAMTCGQPGPGPAVVRLPKTLTPTAGVRATADGRARLVLVAGRTVSVTLPKPPEVTCMSIAPGVLRLTLQGLRRSGPPGVYVVRAGVGAHAFAARLRLP